MFSVIHDLMHDVRVLIRFGEIFFPCEVQTPTCQRHMKNLWTYRSRSKTLIYRLRLVPSPALSWDYQQQWCK